MRWSVAGCVAKKPPPPAPSVFVIQVSAFTMIVLPWYPARFRISTPCLSAAVSSKNGNHDEAAVTAADAQSVLLHVVGLRDAKVIDFGARC